MILKKLISHQGWLNIEAALLHLYPTQQKHITSYEAVYYKLLLLPEAETDLQIEIKEMLPLNGSGNTGSYIDVCGKKWPRYVAHADITLCYALDFTPWAQWLAMPVAAKTLQAFPEAEIVAHCLHTMTRFSFNEEEIGAASERILESIDFVDITADSIDQHITSWEHLIQQLNKEE